ncbi:hypothetical protein PtB15_8B163 [Puccinia triticina]|nr:hypothetical protein PtB15_8B163 [Puccinia triticina]
MSSGISFSDNFLKNSLESRKIVTAALNTILFGSATLWAGQGFTKASIALVAQALEDKSDSEENGVGAPIPPSPVNHQLSPKDSNGDDDDENEKNNDENNDPDTSMDSSATLPPPLRFPGDPLSPDDSIPSQSGPHRSNMNKRAGGGIRAPAMSSSPSIASCSSTSTSQAGSTLEASLAAYYDPVARQKKETETGMTQFYAIQLRKATKTIKKLRQENVVLRMGDQSQVAKLKDTISKQRFQIQALQNKLDMWQMMSNGPSLFHSQPVGRSANLSPEGYWNVTRRHNYTPQAAADSFGQASAGGAMNSFGKAGIPTCNGSLNENGGHNFPRHNFTGGLADSFGQAGSATGAAEPFGRASNLAGDGSSRSASPGVNNQY